MSWKIKILLPGAVLMLVFSGIALAAVGTASGPQAAVGPMVDPDDMGEGAPLGDCPTAKCAQYGQMEVADHQAGSMSGDMPAEMAAQMTPSADMGMPAEMAPQMTPPAEMGMPEEMAPMMTPPADMPMGDHYGQPASGGQMGSPSGGMDSTGSTTGTTDSSGDMGPHMETGTMGTGMGSTGPSGDGGSHMGGSRMGH